MSLILSWSLANCFEFCQLVLPPLRSLLSLHPPREGEKLLLVSRDIEVRHFSLFCKIYIRYTSCRTLKIIIVMQILTWFFSIFTLHSFKWIGCVFIWIFLELGRWFDSFGHHILMIYVSECSHPWSLSVQLIV